jgi:hypothetical protein
MTENINSPPLYAATLGRIPVRKYDDRFRVADLQRSESRAPAGRLGPEGRAELLRDPHRGGTVNWQVFCDGSTWRAH